MQISHIGYTYSRNGFLYPDGKIGNLSK